MEERYYSLVVKMGESQTRVFYLLTQHDFMFSNNPMKNIVVLSKAKSDDFQEWISNRSPNPYKLLEGIYIIQNVSYTEIETIRVREYEGSKKKLGKATVG